MKQVVYVASTESHQIHVWQMNEHGEMSLLQTVSTPDQVQPLITAPDGRHLYAAVKPGNAVATYKIAEDGKLTQTGLTPLQALPPISPLIKRGAHCTPLLIIREIWRYCRSAITVFPSVQCR